MFGGTSLVPASDVKKTVAWAGKDKKITDAAPIIKARKEKLIAVS
jgi:hypothetical protein